MVGFVGAAVDYSHANSVRAAMQAAADATALMLAKNAAKLSASELQTKGNEYFKALFTRPEATGLTLNITYTTTYGSQVTVKATADVKTDFMQLMGFTKLKVAVDSQARWGTTKMQVALALDVTGSMASDGKMPALKTATKELLTTLQAAATTNGDIRVAIVPFAKYVNVEPQQLQRELDRLGGLGRRQRRRQQHDHVHHSEDRQKRQVDEEVHDFDHAGCRTTTTPGTAASPTAIPGLRCQEHDADHGDAGDAVPGRAGQRLPRQDDGSELRLDRAEEQGR